MGRRILTTEEIIDALISSRVRLRRDIRLKYGKYRIVRRYRPVDA